MSSKSLPSKAALVTGAAGFLGSHLCEKLLKEGYFVVAVDNLCTGMKSNIEELQTIAQSLVTSDKMGASWSQGIKFIFINADVTNDWSWENQIPNDWLENLKYVFHFASPASPPLYQKLAFETIKVNTLGLEKALAFANGKKARVIFASTSEIYGDPLTSPQKETYWGNVNSFGPRSCYDESKRLGETLIFEFNKKYGPRHGLVRIFNTYGPRMNPEDGRVVINFLTQALHGKDLTVHGNGQQSRCFCYVDDLIAGIWSYAQKDIFEPINIGSEFEFSVLELAQKVQKIFPDKNLKIEFVDRPMDDPQVRRPDLSRARKDLAPWDAVTPLETGLKNLLDWLKQDPVIIDLKNLPI